MYILDRDDGEVDYKVFEAGVDGKTKGKRGKWTCLLVELIPEYADKKDAASAGNKVDPTWDYDPGFIFQTREDAAESDFCL